jgi:isoleucyl-tRNA synthetase
LVGQVDKSLEAYDVIGSARPIATFVEDLSTWYVRRSRKRFWKAESDRDKLAAYQTLHQTLVTLSALLAPFIPFLSDEIYSNLTGDKSVHLTDYPIGDPALVDSRLEAEMVEARRLVESGLAARDVARIKVRQPLARLLVPGKALSDEVAAIIREELNVKALDFGAAELALDTEITHELRLEGLARNAVRVIQDLRKRSSFNVEDRIVITYQADGDLAEAFEKYAGYLASETLALGLRREQPDADVGTQADIEGHSLWIALAKA